LKDADLTTRVLEDYATAPIDERLRATLRLLEKMTLEHTELRPEDVRAALLAGASKQALADAFEVAFLFNIYDRLADTMGWDVPDRTSGYYEAGAKRLLTHGYR
jgi:alkylhydroperoxidase family enzyme